MAASTYGAQPLLSERALKLLIKIRKSTQYSPNDVDRAALLELRAYGMVATIIKTSGTTLSLTEKGLKAYKQQVS